MRWNHLLPAVLVMAAAATATADNNRVVTARFYDEMPSGASALQTPAPAVGGAASLSDHSPAAGCGCAHGGCAQAGGQAAPCNSCETSACTGCDGGRHTGACGCGKGCKGGKCRGLCRHMNDTLNGHGRHCNVCNQPPHYPYDAVRGYYYFRPYNYRHIYEHQQAVTRWGGDPRNPYSNEIFKSIYAEADAGVWQDDSSVPPAAPAAEEVSPPMPPMGPASASTSRINELRMISVKSGRIR